MLTLICVVLSLFAYGQASEAAVELSPTTSSLMENFTRGHIAYNAGNYIGAIDAYRQCLQEGQSVALHYNLGNSYYRNGDIGRAILHYKKALALDPHHSDVRENLQFVYASTGLQIPRSGLLAKWSTLLSMNTWIWLVTIGFWTSCTLLLLPRLFRLGRSLIRFLLLPICLITALSLAGWVGSYLKTKEGVVVNNETSLKISPTENSPQSAVLQAGAIATVRKERLGWLYITGPYNKTGWVSKQNFQKIWD